MTEYTQTEAERHVLSAMMRTAAAVWEAGEMIQPTDMSVPRHEIIAAALVELAGMDAPTDPIAVVALLEKHGDLSRAGGVEYIHNLDGYTPTPTNVGFYAEIVREASQRRKLTTAGQTAIAAAAEPGLPWADAFDRARAAIDAAGEVTEVKLSGQEANWAMVQTIGTTTPGFPTPWPDVTICLGGLMPGALYVIGARPAVGKSALALQIASELELHGYVGFFSLEMSEYELRRRQLTQQTEIALHLTQNGKHLPPGLQERADQWAHTNPGRILYDDRAELTVGDIRQQIRTWTRDYQLSGIVVDYIQLMSGDPNLQMVQRIGEISRNLKLIAKQFQLPLIALSQLNRGPENRAGGKPGLHDLRDSGAIEQDADAVILLSKAFDDPDTIFLDVAKQRSGPTGDIPLHWQGDFVRAV